MVDEPQIRKLKLKNGASASIASALETWDSLDCMLDTEPELFAALLALAQGRPQEADPEQVKLLPKGSLFGSDGEVLPEVRDVLESGLQITKEGPVLANPFKLETETDRLIVERTAREMAKSAREFGQQLRRLFRGRSFD